MGFKESFVIFFIGALLVALFVPLTKLLGVLFCAGFIALILAIIFSEKDDDTTDDNT